MSQRPTKYHRVFRSVVGLFYPKICAGCVRNLLKGEVLICTRCLTDLAYTDTHTIGDKTIEERLAGKFRFESASALCYYHKSSVIQNLIHQLKYRNNTEVGVLLGNMLGRYLLSSQRFNDVDMIIPIPLHPLKLQKRGYNQSEYIAAGIHQQLEAVICSDNLVRNVHTETQTKKSIYERWKNVAKIFHCERPTELIGRHILLVDDVITSGSTLEGCANALLSIPGVRVSIGVIACAE